MNKQMEKIADSLKIFEKEEKLDYVRYFWRFGDYLGLICGLVFFIIVLITKGEVIHIK